jgi:phage terminase large subunit
MNYHDNPWFPPELEQARKDDESSLDPQTYAWIWEGAYRENSAAQILAGKVRIKEFDPSADWDGPYFGIDWGFSQDPTAGVKAWVNGRALYIEHEAHGVGVENDSLAELFIKKLPEVERFTSRADNARPETIAHVKSAGDHNRACLPKIIPCDKWPGSVEDGISHLRGYESIIVHPRCKHWIEESRMYSYKTDRLTGDVLPDVIDKWNHLMDATRYALGPLIKRKGTTLFAAMAARKNKTA